MWVVCWWMFKNQLSWIRWSKHWFIAFARFCSVPTPTMTDFRLSTCCHWTWHRQEMYPALVRVWTHSSASLATINWNEICVRKQRSPTWQLYNKRATPRVHGYNRHLWGSDNVLRSEGWVHVNPAKSKQGETTCVKHPHHGAEPAFYHEWAANGKHHVRSWEVCLYSSPFWLVSCRLISSVPDH